jgi:acetyl-CoA carboxylase carboxyltransferase component
MSARDVIKQLEEKNAEALAMGGAGKLAQRKAQGVLNARERIDRLVDPGSFTESGRHARSIRPEVRHKTPADGKVAGYARIDGREVALVSNDFTVLGASSSVVNMKKIRHVKQAASRYGMPLVFLGESSGARMPDRMGASGRAILAQDPTEYQRLRSHPWCPLSSANAGSSTCAPRCRFVVMRKGSVMALRVLASPRSRSASRSTRSWVAGSSSPASRAGGHGGRYRRAGARCGQEISILHAGAQHGGTARATGAGRIG